MKLADFDYYLPKELIAQTPATPRDHSRLMILDTRSQKITHDHFFNLPKYLLPSDLLVFNDTKVFPARLYGHKESGGKVEVLLLNITSGEFISHPGLRLGQKVIFENELRASVQKNSLKFNVDSIELSRLINIIGYTPLPHYISAQGDVLSAKKMRSRYQTVYAREIGSVAAPTAGFHFTKKLLNKIPHKVFLTLHVGLGTFRPVKTENIEEHVMHGEQYSVTSDTFNKIENTKGRVIAVGTTSARTLETIYRTPVTEHLSGKTNIFIYPGYKFKKVDALITNFHLPKSTLLMLVSAFAGRELIMKSYQEAIKENYRFYSFGDAMLIVWDFQQCGSPCANCALKPNDRTAVLWPWISDANRLG